MRLAACVALAGSLLLASAAPAAPVVKLGIDVLRDDGFKLLAGKRVGLIVNAASVDGAMRPTVFVVHDARQVNLVALASPEHGIWGDDYAGGRAGEVATMIDPTTGLRVYELYTKSHKAAQPFMDAVDVVVFDLQDIGSRSYTYVSSMKVMLQACAEQDKELIILDRPNPLGGLRVEGSMVADPKFESFVSYLDVPYLHGMTIGELATMVRDEVAPQYRKLTVVKMQGWRREMTWADTGLDWVMTSPHLPFVSSVAGYAATGIMGELYQVSNGVGFTLPFEVAGAPDVDGNALADRLRKVWPDAPGIRFRPIRFKPFYATGVGETCEGVQIYLDPHTAPSLVEVNYRLIEALGGPSIMARATAAAPADAPSSTQPTTDPATAKALARKKARAAATALPAQFAGTIDVSTRRPMFDKVTGSDDVGNALARGDNLAPIFFRWRVACDAFKQRRAKYLLY